MHVIIHIHFLFCLQLFVIIPIACTGLALLLMCALALVVGEVSHVQKVWCALYCHGDNMCSLVQILTNVREIMVAVHNGVQIVQGPMLAHVFKATNCQVMVFIA